MAPADRMLATSVSVAGNIWVCQAAASAGISLCSCSTTNCQREPRIAPSESGEAACCASVSPPLATMPVSTFRPPALARSRNTAGRSLTYV